MGKFRNLLLLVLALAGAYSQYHSSLFTPRVPDQASSAPTASELEKAIAQHQRDVRVVGTGIVKRELPEDRAGNPHQRVLIELASGGTVLIVHNIALAPRIANLAPGTQIEFSGEYIWNERGGLVHWTHHDPHGNHRGGYVKVAGVTYQ